MGLAFGGTNIAKRAVISLCTLIGSLEQEYEMKLAKELFYPFLSEK